MKKFYQLVSKNESFQNSEAFRLRLVGIEFVYDRKTVKVDFFKQVIDVTSCFGLAQNFNRTSHNVVGA